MATIRSYTTIEQSRKLAEILSLESADMIWANDNDVIVVPYDMATRENVLHDFIPCWSLAALLDIIPKRIKDYNILRIDIGEKDFSIWYDEIGYGMTPELPNIAKECPVDACYIMIVTLNKLKIL